MISRKTFRGFAVAMFALTAMAPTFNAASAQTVLTSCGSLATGNYVLGANITTSGDCFTLTGDNVVIDFKGKTVTGDGSGSAVTDGGFDRPFAIIANGKIKNFNVGIRMPGSSNATVSKMDISLNTGLGIVILDGNSVLNSVKVHDNAGAGIDLGFCCNTVSNSQSVNNGGVGMILTGCCATVDKSTISNNAGGGITMSNGFSSVSNSKVSGNGGLGISTTSCCNAIIATKVTNSSGTGVSMASSSDNYITNSTISGSGSDGVVFATGFNHVTASKITNSGGKGISMEVGDANQITASTASGNDVGASVRCPANVVALKASGNSTANLSENTSGGDCSNLNNKAP